MKTQKYLLSLEKNLMLGSGRWVASFTESFWDYPIKNTNFAMMVKGNTRTKGFFLSRFFAYFSLPDYKICCLVYSLQAKPGNHPSASPAESGNIEPDTLNTLIKLILDYMKKNNLAWSWLVITKESPFSQEIRNQVEKLNVRELGIALVDMTSKEITTSDSYIGRRMQSYVRCF